MTENITIPQVTISIPAPLRSFTKGEKRIHIQGLTIQNVLETLTTNFPKLREHLFQDNKIRNFVNVYLNDTDIRYLDEGDQTKLNNQDKILIIPSIAGGI